MKNASVILILTTLVMKFCGVLLSEASINASMERAILQHTWTLVDLVIDQEMQPIPPYYNAKATFCKIDWSLYKKDPSSFSFLQDLLDKDSTCHKVDFYDFVRTSRTYDDDHRTQIVSIPPTGMIVHQSRCGSTLAANMLAAASEQTRVYSEFPPVNALRAFTNNAPNLYNETTHIQLIRDVFYMLGRTNLGEETIDYVFYKSNSGGMYIDKFTAAFPDTPWVYMFRESSEIMASHWKVPEDLLPHNDTTDIPCARQYRSQNQPWSTRQILLERNRSVEELTKTEYCAARLASISRSVLQEHNRTGRGHFINYKDMPAVVWETILPKIFGVAVSDDMKERMEAATVRYSKGGSKHKGHLPDTEWNDDTVVKRKAVTPAIQDAIQLFCSNTFEKLEEIASSQRSKPMSHVEQQADVSG